MVNASDLHVCVIDSGVSNLTSVSNALKLLGVPHAVSGDPAALREATHLLLPGVGSFGAGMTELRAKGLVDVIKEETLSKKKGLFAICLGMQLLADEGFEYGHNAGLGLIPGKVVKIDNSSSGLKLPQIGWNTVRMKPGFRLTAGFQGDADFYFVHSYHFVPQDNSVVAGTCDYGHEVVAMVEKGNVMGAQFHPEKSHTDGMALIRNFLGLAEAS